MVSLASHLQTRTPGIAFMVIMAWILYSLIEGLREGIFFHAINQIPDDGMDKATDAKFHKYIHMIFMIQRAATFMAILIYMPIFIWMTLCLWFPFFHDGFYYYTRNKLDKSIYQAGFLSEPSKTSTAIFDFSMIARWVGIMLGVVLILMYSLNK